MYDDREWYGEPHILTVHSVVPPSGPLDDGELEYEIEHSPSCKEEEQDLYGVKVMEWTCDVAQMEYSEGLVTSLRYSGTPITKPGTYRIQVWGRKYYVWDCAAYEYDGGVAVIEDEN